jgi:hypothetical protein
MNKAIYVEEQTVPRKVLTLIMGGICCIALATAVLLVLYSYYLPAAFAGLIAFMPVLLLLWMRKINLIITVWNDRIGLAYRGGRTPQGMYISDIHFKATISGEDDVEFPFEWITGIEMCEYNAKNDYNGWGQRHGSKKRGNDNTRTFTVSGNKAVIIQLRSGEKILMGTREPEKLLDVLKDAIK